MALNDIVRRGPLSLTAGATALAQGYLVKLHTDATVVVAGAGDVPLGYCSEAAAIGASVAVEPLEGKSALVAGGAISIGNYVKSGASGKVVVEATATTPTAFTIGQAFTASSVDGDAIFIASLR
jgi:hypothetical protein